MKKSLQILSVGFGFALMLTGCNLQVNQNAESKIDIIESGVQPDDVEAWEAEVTADFQKTFESFGTDYELDALKALDSKYGTELANDFGRFALARSGSSKSSGSSDYASMTDMPFNVDGAVYISGGTSDLIGTVIDWVSPKTFDGSYYHGAVLDLDKYDPNNEEVYCLETAVTKGAGYETADTWRHKVNACVLNPKTALNKTKLDAAQKFMDTYCDMDNKDVEYGFFKNKVNIFNIVKKSDMYTWYCTKVVWWVYNKYGIDIDSNSTQIDFKTAGLYSLVKGYYSTIYFYSSKKKNQAINDYIDNARENIVLAEEILCSPYFNKVYENIREN